MELVTEILKMLLLAAGLVACVVGLAVATKREPVCGDQFRVVVYNADGGTVQQFCRPDLYLVLQE